MNCRSTPPANTYGKRGETLQAVFCDGFDLDGAPIPWAKGSQVARARNIDGEMVVSHEGPYKRPPRRTVAASKDHHVRMASPPLPPPEATQAMETHPIRAPREGL